MGVMGVMGVNYPYFNMSFPKEFDHSQVTTGKCEAVLWLFVSTLLSDGTEIGLNSLENLSNWRL